MRAITNRYFCKGDEDAVWRFINNIDWGAFHEHLRRLGFDTQLEVEPYTDGRTYRLHIRGRENLAAKTGIMQSCFESVYLQDFGTFLFQVVDYDEDLRYEAIVNGDFRKTWEDFDGHFGPMTLQVNINLQYKQKNSGENGVRLFCAEYTQLKGWEFAAP